MIMEKQGLDRTTDEVTPLFDDSCRIIDDAQKAAYYSVNIALIKRNWLPANASIRRYSKTNGQSMASK